MKTDGLPEYNGEDTLVDDWLKRGGYVIGVPLGFLLIVGLLALLGAF